MCRLPVTFGGGITSENISPGTPGEAWNSFESIHHSAHRGSNRWGS
jgi:hypothetical protein